MNPQLLKEQPNGTGYICIIFPDTDLPSIDKIPNSISSSSSLIVNTVEEVQFGCDKIDSMNYKTLVETSFEEKQSSNYDEIVVLGTIKSIEEPLAIL